eukprot:253931-Pyramimonas_sp.AAC.1
MREAKLEPVVISPTWRAEARARREVQKITPSRPHRGVESPSTAKEAPQRGCKRSRSAPRRP